MALFVSPLVFASTRNGTVYHDLSSGTYKFVADTVDDGFGTAYGFFEDAVNTTGWGFFTANTNTRFAHLYQYHAMGILEAVLTKEHIDAYGTNQFAEWGFTPSTIPSKLQDFMTESLNYFKSSPNVTDPVEQQIWAQVQSLAAQFAGIVEGYNLACQLTGETPKWNELDLYMLNAAGDMEDLVGVLGGRKPFGTPDMLECSAVVRMTSKDLFVGHATWRSYMLMNRMYKDISINGQRTSFSSQPAFLSSKDDFYITSSSLAVYETTNAIFNTSLYSLLNPHTLLTFVRSTVADYVATTGEQWTDIFSRHNSGTYNNQFGVIDMKLFVPGKPLVPGVFWIIEQIPGLTHRQDVTSVLASQGYWGSYNVPYFTDIFNISGYPSQALANPDSFSYTKCARAQIFARDAPKSQSLSDVQGLMQRNDAADPLSKGDPAYAIASRYDLRVSPQVAHAFGAVDAKITSFSLAAQFGGSVISGPSHQNRPPFSWDDPRWVNISHVGQPATWNFDWVKIPRIPMP